MPAVKALLMWWIQQPDTNKRGESLNKRTILTIVKLIPVVSAVLAYILILSSAQAGVLTTAAVLLAFFGFVFFFIGRKEAKEDKTLKILGWLDLLSTVAVIVLYALAMAAFAGAFGGDGEGDSYSYEAEEQQAGTNIGSFTSVDIEGNEVSEAIFADKDVTVVNLWATFCGPCIEEMPELAAWADEMPGNVGIVGIVVDTPPADDEAGDAAEAWGGAPNNIELAEKICSETGVKYTNILASGSVMKTFENIVAVPTTFIVDRSGNLICPPFVGADVDGYKKAVEEYLAGL